MSAREARDALLAVPVPNELDAQRRAWAVVRGAYEGREPVPRRGRPTGRSCSTFRTSRRHRATAARLA